MAITQDEIRQYAANAGFADADLETATAIAMAESSGNQFANGDLELGDSRGLWQINLHWHPEYESTNLYDEQVNACAAYSIYVAAGRSFKPWSTFKSGAYIKFLPNIS